MKTSSSKNKGRRLQQTVAKALAELYNIEEGNFVSRPMGSPGKDIIISPQVKSISKLYKDMAIECKNVENINLRKVYEEHSEMYKNDFPVVVHKKNKKQELVVISLKDFLWLLGLIANDKQNE